MYVNILEMRYKFSLSRYWGGAVHKPANPCRGYEVGGSLRGYNLTCGDQCISDNHGSTAVSVFRF